MSATLYALSIDVKDPDVLAGYWARLLNWQQDGTDLLPDERTSFRLRFLPGEDVDGRREQIHLHLTSDRAGQQEETVARALELGGRHLDVGQLPEEGHIVLADPEGNAFCVIEFGNNFLKDTAFLGELAGDGTRAVGVFWSQALGWPLVWDQDEETAIQAPSGGPKLAWGGPPVEPKLSKNRMHFDLIAGDSVDDEVERLVALGATRLDSGQGCAGAVAMADPDGNEFCILTTPLG
ncbi:VOC family protein [Kribbella sp. NPDC048915]|uniref:VOC family protein n=1 Tax=Kribbella sp. NPDC048915 TaxID=3155148 RepID=UPI00340242DE